MRTAFVVLCLLLPFDPLAPAETFIVENGRARAEIVLPENAARMARLAAREMQTYLEKISGAKLPIVAEPSRGTTRIYIGKSPVTDALKLPTEGLMDGAYRMASGRDWMALLGPDEDFVPIEPWGRVRATAEAQRVNVAWDKITGDTFWNNCGGLHSRYHADLGVWDYDNAGTLNAVYEFLRGLGVRWYAPGELGEVVPRHTTIALPAFNKTVRPDFPVRRLSYYTEHLGLGELAIWNLRLGLNPAHERIGITQPGHGIKFVLWREEMKRGHPEMYALIKGQRETRHKGTGAPCLSSPMLFEKQLRYSRAMFEHFRQPMLSIDIVDGYGGMHCEDAACRAQMTPDRGWPGSMSDYVWGYLNRVALDLHKSHPGRLVSGLAYSAYQLPPEKIATMSPNLAIIECRGRSKFHDEATRGRHRAVREAWLKKLPSGQYLTWDYYLHAVPEDVGRPVFFPRLIASDLRELKGVSLGDHIEVYQHQPGTEAKFGYDPFAAEHLNLYVTSRLWWDCQQNLDALLNDYYANYYGQAAPQMKAFVEFSESNWMRMTQDAAKIAQSFALLEAAQKAVESQSAPGKRIQKIADLMKPLRTMQQQLGRKHETELSYRVLETYQAGPRLMKDKKLDGQLTKDFWPEVRIASLAKLQPGTRAKVNSHFQVLREGDILYFGIHCEEPDMDGLNIASRNADDPKLLEGDFVSLLIETPGHSYYEIAVNPAGTVLEIDRSEGGAGVQWSSGAQVAVHRGTKFWSVEIRLPITGEGSRLLNPLQGVDGGQPRDLFPWHFNVGRQRVRSGEIERTAYSPTEKENLRVREKFAKLWGK